MFNLPAVFIVMAVTFLLIRGTRESARANLIMVGLKIVILVFFIVAALTSFDINNFKNFSPHGFSGITTAAGLIFFAYIGFDAVATGVRGVQQPRQGPPQGHRRVAGRLAPSSTSWSRSQPSASPRSR